MKAILFLVAALIAGLAQAAGGSSGNAGHPAFFDAQGIKVLSSQKGPGGLTAWKVEKGTVKTVFYTTADDKVLISGVLWDAKTGANLSDAFLTADVVGTAPAAEPAAPKVAPAAAPGQIPEALKGIDRLVGVKEGKGSVEQTLYIIFDPRCPHCHAVYSKTRQFVASGGTIKWIPATVVGRQSSVPFVAYVLQDQNPVRALSMVMTLGDKAPVAAKPTGETLKAIAENESYFWAAFDRNPGAGAAGVPVGFFLTKAGVPQMVGELDNDALLQRIIADMKR